MLCIYGRHDVHSHCIGSHFLISDLKISMSFKFLSSRGTIFHTLDAKYRREFNPKKVVLRDKKRKHRKEAAKYLLKLQMP